MESAVTQSIPVLADQDWMPQKIGSELLRLQDSAGELEEHRLLLKIGEELLTHLTGILFGEYKKSEEVRKDLEEKLYINGNGKALSFGKFLEFFRDLGKAQSGSILESLLKDSTVPAVTELAFQWKLLKEVVNSGVDSGFQGQVNERKSGQSASKKTILDFFEVLVNIRNTDAHPQGKASNPTRDWPQGSEYYAFVNPWLKEALAEALQKLQSISSHSPALVEAIHDEEKTADILLETGQKKRKEVVSLGQDDIDFLITEKRYLFDEVKKPYAKLYVNEIPSLDPQTASAVIAAVKAKQAEPALEQLIVSRLHSHALDELDYVFLKEAANAYKIDEERLLTLIKKTKKKVGYEGELVIQKQAQSVAPDNIRQRKSPEHYVDNKKFLQQMFEFKDATAEARENREGHPRVPFNPYWLTYFGRLSDNTVTKDEDPYSTTNVHRRLWKEVTHYLEYLVESYLDSEETSWVVKPNQFQIGALSYSYWGQIYPENSPFENAFAIGFAVAKKFKWGKAKNRKDALHAKLSAPSVVLYTTKNRKGLEDIDPDSVFLRRYFSENFNLLGREQKALEDLGVNVGDHEGNPGDDGKPEALLDSKISTIADYFDERERNSGMVQLYSRIWTIEDFLSDGAISTAICGKFEREIILLLNLFANSIKNVSDFAIANGTNTETIHALRDQVRRKSKLLKKKQAQYKKSDRLDAKGKAELRDYGKSLGLKKYQIESMLGFNK